MRTACFVVQLIELKNPGAGKESRDGELRRSSGGAVEVQEKAGSTAAEAWTEQ